MSGVGEVAVMTLLLKALGIGLVPGLVLLIWMVMRMMTGFVERKQDADRAERSRIEEMDRRERIDKEERDRDEHMVKWNSMMEQQDKMIAAQKETTQLIISSNREDLKRLYDFYKEQSDSIRVISHHIATLTAVLEQKTICPNDLKHKG